MSYKQWWTDSVADYDSAKMHVYETKDEEEFRKRGWQGDEQSLGSKQLIEMGILNKDSVVLEIGCGVARLGREFAPHVKEWYGCDISPKMLKFAKERTSHLTNVHFHELNGIELPMFGANKFDFVYSTIVFMHLDKEDMFQYLKESYRILKPGKIGYFDTWNLLNDKIFDHFLKTQSGNIGDKKTRNRNQYSTGPEMKKYFEKIGYEIISLSEEELLKCLVRKPLNNK